jgi:aspartate/methionine/tyrosine aminotransferase
MKSVKDCTKEELESELVLLQEIYESYKGQKLKLNMARGKPSPSQLDISMSLLDGLDSYISEDGTDVRNYGGLEGIPECRKLFAELLEVPEEQILIGGNASLNMMFDTIASHMLFGTAGEISWKQYALEKEPVKFLCPVPGYDRHFTICEELGIEMINIPLNADGPDMEKVQELVENDESIKGIWCVPLHSNPEGVCYSDEVVKKLLTMQPAAKDFRIFWDNAYGIHYIYEKVKVANILVEAKKQGVEDRVYSFFSTSKITFPGAGIAVMSTGKNNLKEILHHMNAQTISHDKINQLRHVQYFKSAEGVLRQMDKLADLLRPKFDIVLNTLERELKGTDLATWSKPKGGYFISLNTKKGCAKETVKLAKEAGVVLTSAGATYPYKKDMNDANIRIAPSYPTEDELQKAMAIFVVCVKIAGIKEELKNEQEV